MKTVDNMESVVKEILIYKLTKASKFVLNICPMWGSYHHHEITMRASMLYENSLPYLKYKDCKLMAHIENQWT